MGKSGEAILYLQKSEETYIQFLENRNVPIQERSKAPDVPNVLQLVHERNRKQREFLDKSQEAYVSYVRGYKEHHCANIFRFAALDLGQVANGFGLVRIPKMPDLKDRDTSAFTGAIPIEEYNAIPYQDKSRELHRKRKLQEVLDSRQKERQRRERRQKNADKREKRRYQKFLDTKKQNNRLTEDEIDDINKEANLLKKLKRRKISQEEYDRLTGEDDEL